MSFLQVCTNGLLTVGSLPLRFYEGSHFPSSNTRISQSNILAPFWNDHDARDSNIYYKVYNSGSDMQYVSRFISFQEGVQFDGTWMIAAQWVDVPPFPYTAQRATVSKCISAFNMLL